MYVIPRVSETDRQGRPFFIEYEKRETRKSDSFYASGSSTLVMQGAWREKLQLFADMCEFGVRDADNKQDIVRRLEIVKKRETYSVYSAFYYVPMQGTEVLVKKYAAWMAIQHNSAPLPNQLVYLCVAREFQGLALGKRMLQHYETLVGVAANLDPSPGQPATAWAKVTNSKQARTFFRKAGWIYKVGDASSVPFSPPYPQGFALPEGYNLDEDPYEENPDAEIEYEDRAFLVMQKEVDSVPVVP